MRKLLGLAVLGLILLPTTPALAADPTDGPTPLQSITSAGTSFLTAVTIAPEQQVKVSAVTGDYLYWQFPATAGQRPEVTIDVTLPTSGRSGDHAWTVEVFDGLRRRQACVGGEQSPVAKTSDTTVTLGCRLRQVRSWAEPWDGDPLPGTYYVRLSSTDLPEKDLGLPLDVALSLKSPTGDTGADQGELAAPLVPNNQPGKLLTTPQPSASATPDDTSFDISMDWLPDFSSRWVWTVTGGIIAAITGLIGFSWTRRRRV